MVLLIFTGKFDFVELINFYGIGGGFYLLFYLYVYQKQLYDPMLLHKVFYLLNKARRILFFHLGYFREVVGIPIRFRPFRYSYLPTIFWDVFVNLLWIRQRSLFNCVIDYVNPLWCHM